MNQMGMRGKLLNSHNCSVYVVTMMINNKIMTQLPNIIYYEIYIFYVEYHIMI
jgi:hypothetical protein